MRPTARSFAPWLLAAAVAACGTAPALADRVAPPPPQKATPLRFPPFAEKTLTNGLKVVVVEHHELPLVSTLLLLPAGRLYEPADKAGISTATAALIDKGTPTRSALQIASAIDQIGGSFGAGAGADTATLYQQVTVDQIDRGLDLLADSLLHPSFPAEELERWRKQALSGLTLRQSNPGSLAGDAFNRLLFGRHPYGLPSQGTPATVAALTRDDVVAFHRRCYVPRGAILAIVGDVKADATFARVERALGGWTAAAAPSPPPFEVPAIDKLRIVAIDRPGAVQTVIRAGQVGIAFKDPAYFPMLVYNSVVAGGASGRLYDEIREKRGLAYGAYGFWSADLFPGAFSTFTSTKTTSTVEALGVLLDVLRKARQEPVADSELGPAKTKLTGAFPLSVETPEQIGSQVLNATLHGLGKAFLDSYRDRIDAVDAAQVQRFAQTHTDPDRMLVVVVGDVSAFGEELKKKFGPFTTLKAEAIDLMSPDLGASAVAGKGAGSN